MEHILIKNEIVHKIRELNVIERLNIITDIWDEIKDSQELEKVSEKDKKLLLSRLTNYRSNPSSATDWDILKQEVYGKHAEQN
jgi:putative addiction module component (TIGR02574 family)